MLGFLLAPYLLEKTLVNTLQEDYAASLRVENIDINPFVLSLRVEGLELDNPAGDPTARVGEIYANFQLSSLFRLALTFDEISITSPQLFVSRNKAGDFDFTYLLPSDDAEPVEAVDVSEEESSLLALLIFNFAIEDFSIDWIDDLPVDQVKTRLGPISIEISELNTLPDRSGQQAVVIATENSGLLSWTGDLQLNPLHSVGHASVKDTRFPVISSYIRRQAGIEIVDGRAGIEMNYEVSSSTDGGIEAVISDLNLTLDDLVLRSFSDDIGLDFAGDDEQFLAMPSFRLSDGELRWPQQTVSLGAITIDNPQIDISRNEDGVFSLEPKRKELAQQIADNESSDTESASDDGQSDDEWQISLGKLSVNDLVFNLIDQTVEPAAELGITEFNLDISDLSNLPGKRFPTQLGLIASSGGKLSLDGEFSVLPDPTLDFNLNVDALQLVGLQPYIRQQANLNLDSGAVNLQGRIKGTTEDPFAFGGDLKVVDLVISESIKNERLASWKEFSADKIAFSTAQRQLDISRLRFDQPYGDILIDEEGGLNVGQVKKTSEDMAAPEPTQAESEGRNGEPEFNIRIGDIAVVNASADFADMSLPLPFSTRVHALNGKITTVSTASSAPSEVSFEGNVDDYGFARITGTVTPLDPSQNTDLVLKFENIDVPHFTPYSIPIAGRKVKSGVLDLQLGYRVQDSALIGDNKIVLRDFQLGEKVPHPEAMSIPLDLAVALLKDANGKIDIDLPVRGNVDDPNFSYGSVVVGALGKLLGKIVVSPFAALGGMFGMEASELEHVKFIEGRSDLTPPEKEKAEKLAEALSQRPELRLLVPGAFAAEADALALRTNRVDNMLELKISALATESSADTQFADMRQQALEQLFREQFADDKPADKLEALQREFTTTTKVEGQTGATSKMDDLAYANALRLQLIDAQIVDDGGLAGLASSRAEALKAAMVAANASLQDRIAVVDNVEVTSAPGEPIRMKVTLTTEAE